MSWGSARESLQRTVASTVGGSEKKLVSRHSVALCHIGQLECHLNHVNCNEALRARGGLDPRKRVAAGQ